MSARISVSRGRGLLSSAIGVAMAVAAAMMPTKSAEAQVQGPALWLIQDGGDVIVQLSRVPEPFSGFHVERSMSGEEFVRLTTEPVVPQREPSAFLAALGEAASELQDLTHATTPFEVARLVQADPATANIYGYLYPEVANALGRRYRDAADASGATVGWRYRVVFVDPTGADTDQTLEAELSASLPMAVPTGLEWVDDGSTAPSFRWRFSPYGGAVDDIVVGFHVYRSLSDSELLERRTVAPVVRNDLEPLRFIDRETTPGEGYSYRVRAVDLLGREGPISEAIEYEAVSLAPPAVPSTPVATAGDGVVHLVWRMSPEADLAGYWVERSFGLDQPYERLTSVPVEPTVPTWMDSTAVAGVRQVYRVVAVDDAGRESRPSNGVTVVPFDASPPDPVSGLAVDVVGRTLLIDWQASTSPDVVGYHVYRGESAARLGRLTTSPVADVSFLDAGFAEGLVPGQEYMVRVTSVDGAQNESAAVGITVVVPDDLPPSAPTGFHVENPTGRDIRISWNASAATDVERYVLLRATGDPAALQRVDSLLVDERRLLIDTDVTPGVTHHYELIPVDRAGNEGEAARASILFGDHSPPASVNFVEAGPTETGAFIRWERSGSEDVIGYRVERADLATGRFQPIGDTVLPGQPLELTDAGGRVGHYYRVVSVDSSGNDSRPSRPVRVGGGR